MADKEIKTLLRSAQIDVSPETFTLVSLKDDEWRKLLENPELSPRMTAPFMIFKDKFETTLLLDEIDFGALRHAVRDAKTEGGFRLLTFDIELDFDVVGFFAEIARILAKANISIVALSSFSRDQILVKQTDLSNALKSLSEHIDEAC